MFSHLAVLLSNQGMISRGNISLNLLLSRVDIVLPTVLEFIIAPGYTVLVVGYTLETALVVYLEHVR